MAGAGGGDSRTPRGGSAAAAAAGGGGAGRPVSRRETHGRSQPATRRRSPMAARRSHIGHAAAWASTEKCAQPLTHSVAERPKAAAWPLPIPTPARPLQAWIGPGPPQGAPAKGPFRARGRVLAAASRFCAGSAGLRLAPTPPANIDRRRAERFTPSSAVACKRQKSLPRADGPLFLYYPSHQKNFKGTRRKAGRKADSAERVVAQRPWPAGSPSWSTGRGSGGIWDEVPPSRFLYSFCGTSADHSIHTHTHTQ